MQKLLNQLESTGTLTKGDWVSLIKNRTPALAEDIFSRARSLRHTYYGHDVYIRGLIEFTNYCKNDCYYCGIRKSNEHAHRYRLTEEEIMDCCHNGYELGFRTFVLQGGEDGFFTTDRMVDLVTCIKKQYPGCAITLSIGELDHASYQALYDAGADRYLLRHETWNSAHYGKLHPPTLTASHRQQCLWDLKEIGYQVGTGFMVGSPFQTPENLAEDMLFLKELDPQMVGIGPFISHKDTPFCQEPGGTLELTLYMLGLIRLLLPKVLLPATTALGTISPDGREKGILAGANVVMPNLSPTTVRKDYSLYDNKICTGDESAQCIACMTKRMESIGYHISVDRGDSKNITRERRKKNV